MARIRTVKPEMVVTSQDRECLARRSLDVRGSAQPGGGDGGGRVDPARQGGGVIVLRIIGRTVGALLLALGLAAIAQANGVDVPPRAGTAAALGIIALMLSAEVPE